MKQNNMKKYITILLTSFIVGVSVYAFQPATLFIETWEGIKRQAVYSQEQANKLFKQGYKLDEGFLGTSVTTIEATDTLKNSRTTINDNFTALNSGKIEISTTTLPNITTLVNLSSIGTITTGIWSSTAIGVSKGGTGLTSPTLYYVPIGNGSSGFTFASSTGTTGQFLTSNGTGAYPSWQSSTVDQTADYTWTGTHTGIGIVGEIIAYASSTAPTGWLLCNGASVATSTYANLYSLIGYLYGGSGANFNLPDLRGRNILMASTTANMAQTGGESSHTQTWSELAAHSHTFSSMVGSDVGGSTGANFKTAPFTSDTSTTGTSTPMNVLDPYLVLNYIIKY